MAGNKTDVFPSSPVAELRRLPEKPNFQVLLSKVKMYAFIVYMDVETIYCKPVEFTEKYRRHFLDTGNHIKFKRFKRCDDKDWDATAKRLQLPVAEERVRRNVDTRTCFKYGTHFFLVKSCYTPGQRTVQRGHKHVYQIGAVQMVLYFANRGEDIVRRDKSFYVDDQFKYNRRNLQPHTAYAIPEGTIYVLLATKKSFFSVHVMPAEATVPFLCRDPRQKVPRRPDTMYVRPPPTPMIEDAVIGDEEEMEEKMPPPPPPMKYESVTPPPPPPPPSPMKYESVTPPPPPPHPVAAEPILVDLEPEPEPEPPAVAAYHITFATMPIEKTIKVVTPDLAHWYQQQFKWAEFHNPRLSNGPIFNCEDDPKVLDLSLPKNNVETEIDRLMQIYSDTTTATAPAPATMEQFLQELSSVYDV